MCPMDEHEHNAASRDAGGRATGRKPARGVTMETVGRLAGVSQVTVSRALSDPSKVSPKTLAKIHEAIEMTGFVPNALAGALASSKSKLISALVPSIRNFVYAGMVQAFSAVMRDNGYQIMLSETGFEPEEEEKLIAAHLSRRPDAMMLTGIHHSAQARRMLLGADIPVVEVWDITDSPIDVCVGFSHADTGRAVAEFAHANGYRQAGCVAAGDERARRRARAFSERFKALGGEGVAIAQFDAPASLERGRQGLAQLMDAQGFAGGVVFCSSDLLAHGVLVEARERGLQVPGQLAVIGFGDQDFSAFVTPAITTVRVNMEAFGQSAARAVLERIEAQRGDQSVIDLGFEIVRRESA
jgi:LacI family transcriptional regulator, gluconate utilization system Gnt-I transcriptional repressor